jgi:hypothetical protein
MVLAALALVSPAANSATICSQATDTVAAPSGGYLRTLYSVDFESPTHHAGTFPSEGMGPKTVGYYGSWNSSIAEAHKGNPEVVASQPLLDGQSAEFNARPVNSNVFDYDSLDFQLGRKADYYTLDTDLVIEDMQDGNRLVIQLHDNDSGNQCSVVFNDFGNVYMTQNLASYNVDTRYHLNIIATPNGDETGRLHLTLSSSAGVVYQGQFILALEGHQDFGLIRFQAQDSNDPDTNYAQADNIIVKAAYQTLPTLIAADEDNQYVLDFLGNTVMAGKYYLEKDFAVLFGVKTSEIGNGSSTIRFANDTRPVITHRLGIPFDLIQFELGEYSSTMPTPTPVTITGHFYDGTTVTRQYTTDGVADGGAGGLDDMEVLTFDDSWQGLSHVTLSDKISLDKLTLKSSIDRDNDAIHDWIDGCLASSANEENIESADEKTAACAISQTVSSSSSGGGNALWLLPLLASLLIRLRHNNVAA